MSTDSRGYPIPTVGSTVQKSAVIVGTVIVVDPIHADNPWVVIDWHEHGKSMACWSVHTQYNGVKVVRLVN